MLVRFAKPQHTLKILLHLLQNFSISQASVGNAFPVEKKWEIWQLSRVFVTHSA
jgi:hypothetical protein